MNNHRKTLNEKYLLSHGPHGPLFSTPKDIADKISVASDGNGNNYLVWKHNGSPYIDDGPATKSND